MKRHDALVPLSRDHHGALILAKLLQKGAPAYKELPTDLPGKAAYASRFFDNELTPHFAAEEKCLLGYAKGVDAGIDALLETMKEQHLQLRTLFGQIATATDLATHLDATGALLEAHVRMEERQLFPLIQEHCSAEQLQHILVSLTH
jgi:iron-sulfur cluster repair protein YtfE (RIC family)